jgi:small-conductance mechanosensitive channel
MTIRTLLLLILLVLLPAAATAQSAPAPSPAPANTTGLNAAQAQAALSVLQDDAKRAALIAALHSVAQPAAGAPGAPPPAEAGPLEPDSLGAQLLTRSSALVAMLSAQLVTAARTITDFPLLLQWGRSVAQDAAVREEMWQAAWRVVAGMAAALALEQAMTWLLSGLRRAVVSHAPPGAIDPHEAEADLSASDPSEVLDMAEAGEIEAHGRPLHGRLRAALTLLRRLPFAAGVLLLDLVPLAVFAAVANALAGSPLADSRSTELSLIAVATAYVAIRAATTLTRAALAPDEPRLRLIAVNSPAALFMFLWIRRLMLIAVIGYTLDSVGLLFGLYPRAYEALLKVVGLAVHLSLVLLVVQARAPVAAWIAGHRGDAPDRRRSFAFTTLRRRMAEIWHWLAVIFIMGVWLVYAIELRNGLQALLHFLLVTALVLGAARLLNILLQGALARAVRLSPRLVAEYPGLQARTAHYAPAVRAGLSLLLTALTVVTLLQVWGLGAFAWFGIGNLGGRIVTTAMRLAVALAVAALVWEIATASMQSQLTRLAQEGQAIRAVRLRTLLPMLRTTLLIAILVIVGLMTLSEIGVDIAPLLAGAGIVGVAIGFGSQKLVQDVITGIFLLLENTMQVGDFVTLGGLSGNVEHLSIRTIRLRAGDGAVHIIPFSSVTTVTNTNRGLGNVPIAIELEYDQDTDAVCDLLRAVVEELRADPAMKGRLAGELQIWGVDKVSADSVVVAGQIPCTDAGRWPVQRAFNRLLQQRFRQAGVRLATHARELVLRHPLDVRVDQVGPPPASSLEAATPGETTP